MYALFNVEPLATGEYWRPEMLEMQVKDLILINVVNLDRHMWLLAPALDR